MAAGAHLDALRPSGPAVWVRVDGAGRVVEAAEAFTELCGPVAALPAVLAPPSRARCASLLAGEVATAVLGGRRADGVPFAVHLGVVAGEAGGSEQLLVGFRAGGPVTTGVGEVTPSGAGGGRGIDHVLSHDLRGALRQATGFVTVTRRGLVTDESDIDDATGSAGHLDIALRSLATADAITEAVVRWLRLGDAPLSVRRTPVTDLVELARRALSGRVGDEAAGARVVGPTGAVPAVVVDPAVVTDALVELLANAVVFWPTDAAVVVDAAIVADGWCEVTVTDAGPGVDDVDAAFAPGRMLQARGAFPGVGMGLAIAAVAAGRHGGWCALRPGSPDGGTVAVLGLPVG